VSFNVVNNGGDATGVSTVFAAGVAVVVSVLVATAGVFTTGVAVTAAGVAVDAGVDTGVAAGVEPPIRDV
jgi:hypothetical protein